MPKSSMPYAEGTLPMRACKYVIFRSLVGWLVEVEVLLF